ncbi:MAG: twitching motility protein PilT [Candidatus Melainabacteria bacterium HGW-Melainabacteria-1]|nr:MAG: twitching motility protein PilT [Candidatus Melainabacteria bacterium HGW-Melainabacteria-1]
MTQQIFMEELLQLVFDKDGSDLHIAAGVPPMIRVNGKLAPTDFEPLQPEDTQKLIFSILTNEQRKTLEQTWELDCSYGVVGLGRFRVNVYKDKGSYAAALRTIASKIPRFDELGLPPVVKELIKKPRGLILVTGPTGSGKSTTLASMIDLINTERAEHILTIEDPIEYVHVSKKSLVNQRELGEDTRSFDNALRAALREDPDVVLVGEMRDLETIRLALTAAETGHLVFGTLHTSSASQTVDRVVDVFPPHQQTQIRIQLSNSLVAVLSQTLLARASTSGDGMSRGKGRVMAMEIMMVTPAIANLIREGKTAQIYSSIQTGGKYGMVTLEMCLRDLYLSRQITFEDAITKTSRQDDFQRLINESGHSTGARR